jgi:uncharacterized protein (DUF433 family)
MGRIDWRERIVANPRIHAGDPCVKGTRIPVSIIVGSLADGMTPEEIIAQYPQLTPDDIRAALSYAADLTQQEVWYPLKV